MRLIRRDPELLRSAARETQLGAALGRCVTISRSVRLQADDRRPAEAGRYGIVQNVLAFSKV